MSPLLQIVAAGVGTYLIRISAIALAGRVGPPSAATEATLRLIGPSVLGALVADRLFLVDGEVSAHWQWWVAGVIAGGVAWWKRSAGLTVGLGMIAVWILGAVA